jgi:hypothetical protein
MRGPNGLISFDLVRLNAPVKLPVVNTPHRRLFGEFLFFLSLAERTE